MEVSNTVCLRDNIPGGRDQGEEEEGDPDFASSACPLSVGLQWER